MHSLLRSLSLCVLATLAIAPSRYAAAQAELPNGFIRLEGTYVDVITDLPVDDELLELPKVFDLAMPRWCEIFDMTLEEVQDWHVEAHVMLDRDRFASAGLIPEHLPNFPYGFQFGNQLWLVEQPSTYYRRHLLLHEGTHWFMSRKYGQYGPPWLMEGMAEWLGTHRWSSGKLEMGIIPATKTEVPYWGRITLIQEQYAEGLAPSLESILRYGSTAHQQVEAYAWSWAAVLFLSNHPTTKEHFAALLRQPMKSDLTLTRWLYGRLRTQFPSLRQDWSAFLSELEYGYDPTSGMLVTSRNSPLLSNEPKQVTVRASGSWQSAGVSVAAGTLLHLAAAGEYSVGQVPRPWVCQPDGVTLEYYHRQPIGKLMLALATPLSQEPQFTPNLEIFPVGSQADLSAPHDGELFFRVNESNGGLLDNQGLIQVTITP